MKRTFFSLLLILSMPALFSTNYYVCYDTGNDQNNGLSPDTPFKLIQTAADLTLPGDTVFVMNSVYSNYYSNLFTIHRPGSPDAWIVFINYPGHSPLLQFDDWNCIQVINGACYIEINGFTIQGNASNIDLDDALDQPGGCNDPNGDPLGAYNGNGIQTHGLSSFSNGYPHHIRIVNNTIFDCCGSGIGSVQCDYLSIENNLLYNNCWYSIWGTSAISLYQNWNLDSTTNDYRMIIKGNTLYGNKNLVPTKDICLITDGNGIIIDDSKNSQHGSTLGAYLGRTYVANNVVYGNGGPGIHVYYSEHVDIVNNTTYYNQQSDELAQGEIDAWESGDIVIRNNVLYAKADKPINTNTNNTEIIHDYNLYFGGNGSYVNGENTIIADPLFIDPTLQSDADFQLSASSPAIDNGTDSLAPDADIINTPRPIGPLYDIGAYEYDPQLVLGEDLWPDMPDFYIYPNPARDILHICVENTDAAVMGIYIIDSRGKTVFRYEDVYVAGEYSPVIELSGLSPGIYIIHVRHHSMIGTRKLVIL